MADKITLQQIARAAKVSLATASRVLNKTGRVSPEAERRVRAALVKMGSSGERTARSYTLCFLLANRPMLHPFHAHALMGAHSYAAEHGNHILFYPFSYGAGVSPDDLRLPLLLERRGIVDGYIVSGMNSPNLLELLSRAGVPFAVLGNNVLGEWDPSQFDVVWIDDITGANETTQYLLGLGHRSICFLGSRRIPSARMEQGYSRAMEEAGQEPHIVESDSADERDSGYIALKGLLSRREAATAVFAHTDSVAHGALEAALSCGLRVPENISIAGFGDRPEATAMTPALTTVCGYPDQVGRRLAELVLKRIVDREAPPSRVLLPTRLIKRDSCGRVAGNAPASSPADRPAEPRNAMEIA
ncbi:MAG TPA: LacI family DNA-binding transcriptional regulator [Bryobacteraceae bacterium]